MPEKACPPHLLQSRPGEPSAAPTDRPSALQLKAALRGRPYDEQVQLLSTGPEGDAARAGIHQKAQQGLTGGGGALPHREAIQRSFGRYDVSDVLAHTDAHAKSAADAMGADAYATGNHIVLGDKGHKLHTVAHETAHVVQQRAGVSLSGGVGKAGDPYEKHADAVADLVVQGKSAEGLLGEMTGGGGGARSIQKREAEPPQHDVADAEAQTRVLAGTQTIPEHDSPKAVEAARVQAILQLFELERAMTDMVLANYDWITRNILVYHKETGGAGGLSYTGPEAVNLGQRIADAASSISPDVAGLIAERGVGWALGGMTRLAAIAGGLVSHIISALWKVIEDESAEARVHRAVNAATRRLGEQIEASLEGAKGRRDQDLAEWRAEATHLQGSIKICDDAGLLRAIREGLSSQTDSAMKRGGGFAGAPPTLAREMLARWVMRTAKDSETGGKDVNPETHREARAWLQKEDLEERERKKQAHAEGRQYTVVEPKVRVDAKRIFIEQCRYEWEKLGVDATQILAYLEWIGDNHGLNGVGGMASQAFSFQRVANASAMMRYLASHRVVDQVGRHEKTGQPDHSRNATSPGYRQRRILAAVMHGTVNIDCQLRVETDPAKRSAFVTGFGYTMRFVDPKSGEERAVLETRP